MATKTVSVLTGGTNNHTETSENINALGTDFISQGIVGAVTATSGVAPTTGGFAVNAQGTPNMTVRVTAGTAYVTGTPTSGNSQLFRVSMSTFEDVTIAANSSGSTKYDWIYIKLDAAKLKDPAVDASDVATLVASRSTSSSTDDGTPPTYGYKLAVVTVVNGAASIANASIADGRTQTGANAISGQLKVQPNTAPPAAGLSTSGILMSSTSNLGIFYGSGAPTFSAAQGSIYMRTDGSSTSTRMYVNTTGSTTWTNFTSAA